MRRIFAAAAALLLSGSIAKADGTIDTLGAAAAIADANIIPVCQGCSGATAALGATGTQLTTYFRAKLSGTSPVSYNSSTGAISLPLTSAHLLVGSGGGVATDVALSGDGTLANTGALTIASIGGKAVTLGGTLTTSGASALTLTTTGATSLTLPAGTDVLVSRNSTDTLTLKTLTAPTINTATIAGGTINNAVIGGTNPVAGSFTTLNLTGNITSNITGSTQCVHASSSGVLSGSGADCGTGGGGGTSVLFTGTSAGTANAQTIASPTPTGFTLTDQYIVRVKIGAGLTNTAAATLNVNSTGATAIKGQNNGGTPAALTGGELVAGNEYDLVYNSGASAFVITTALPSGSTIGATTTTVTQAQWASFHLFVVSAASQVITLPVATSLSAGGGILIQAVGTPVTLTPNAADGIKVDNSTPTVGVAAIIPAGATTIITTSGSSGTGAFFATKGTPQRVELSWASGQNLAGSTAISIGRQGQMGTVTGIVCRPDTVVGGTATIAVWTAPSGTALTAGTKINTTDCNANTGAATEQSLGVASATIPAGNWIGIAATGAGWSTSTGAGGLQVTIQ